MRLKVGTRGSKLALIQTQLVTDSLQLQQPDIKIETVIIKTEGDRNLAPIPLDTVGKAWFTAELDRALSNRTIDLAVHSLKDLPLALEPGLTMVTALEREDPRDVLISKSGATLDQLPGGAVIGTDSTRRGALIRHLRPDLQVRSLRGNVQTRLRKLHEQAYDGIILAAAGLKRLGQLDLTTEFLDPTSFIPSIGQGVLALEVRADHAELLALLSQIQHPATVIAATAERTFSATVGGGCKLPVGCFAEIQSGQIRLHGMIAELDGPHILFKSATGPVAQANNLAETLGRQMLVHS